MKKFKEIVSNGMINRIALIYEGNPIKLMSYKEACVRVGPIIWARPPLYSSSSVESHEQHAPSPHDLGDNKMC